MAVGVARLKGVLSVDDGAVGRYDGEWADPPQQAYAFVSADESRIALVAARREELGEIGPAVLGTAQGSAYEVSLQRPSYIVASRADVSDLALRLSDMSGGLDGDPGISPLPSDGLRLDWGDVEAVADLAPADRAARVLAPYVSGSPRGDVLTARIGCLLARDRTYGLARLMTRRNLSVLADGAFPPAPEYAGRNGEGGPACPYAYANVASALNACGIRAEFYDRLSGGLSSPRSAGRARGFDEGVLSGGLRPWARHALLAEGAADKDAYASSVYVNPSELGEAILLARRIMAGLASDPLSVVALAMPFREARALPERSVSSDPALAPWIGTFFPEARFLRQFACVGRPPQGGVAIGMAWARSRAEAVPLLAQTGVQTQVVHDVSRMLNLPGDALCFGCSQPGSGAPVTRPPGQSLH